MGKVQALEDVLKLLDDEENDSEDLRTSLINKACQFLTNKLENYIGLSWNDLGEVGLLCEKERLIDDLKENMIED